MNNKWLLVVLAVFCLILMIFSSLSNWQIRTLYEKSLDENRYLLDTITTLKEDLENTQSRIRSVADAMNRYSGLSDTLRKSLISKGHSDPEGFLLNALKEKEHLIKSAPVLGGTFFFVKLVLLRDDLAYAEFEDGHISGYLLIAFRYDATQDQVDASNAFEFLE